MLNEVTHFRSRWLITGTDTMAAILVGQGNSLRRSLPMKADRKRKSTERHVGRASHWTATGHTHRAQLSRHRERHQASTADQSM